MPSWNLFVLLYAEVLALLLGWHWIFLGGICVSVLSFFLFLSRLLLQKCWKSIFSLEILVAWDVKVLQQWLLEHGFRKTTVNWKLGCSTSVSCTLVLGKITFIVLLPAQLCCVAALQAMERWSSGEKIHVIHYLWSSCSFSKVLVALPFEDF